MQMPVWARYMYNVQVYVRNLLGIPDGPLHILEPIGPAPPSSPEILLLIVQGAFTPAEAYLPLAHAIQEASSQVRLWVAVPTYMMNLALAERVRQTFPAVLARVKEAGFRGDLTPANVFMAGHSAGGMTARDLALEKAAGFVQMAAYFDSSQDSLPQFPKPVLMISGERDGQMVPTVIANHAGEIFRAENKLNEANTVAQKPVIIVKGMNHAQFSHGNPNFARGDFTAEIPLGEARGKVASAVSSFLEYHVIGPNGPASEKGYEILKRDVELTRGMFRPFWEAKETQRDGVEDFQVQLAYLGKKQPEQVPFRVVTTWHDFKTNFIYSKPTINVRDRVIYLNAILKPQGRWKMSSTISLKLKSQEAIEGVLPQMEARLAAGSRSSMDDVNGNSTREETQSGASETVSGGLPNEKDAYSVPPLSLDTVAANFNARVFAKALALTPVSARQRFLKDGKKLAFLPDKRFEIPPEWVDEDVAFMSKSGERVVEVISPVTRTGLVGVPMRLAGMHYVTILTTARAMEFILIDGLR